VVPASGPRTVESPTAATTSRFDCFYVYPTVSTQRGLNANLRVQPAEVAAAVDQASPFSRVCRVWAPMYRQVTLAALGQGRVADPTGLAVAYASLLSAFQDYLRHDNHGRPIIFIGHSQGAAMLNLLLSRQVDDNPALRARTVSAIIVGGNVTVRVGRDVGGTFRHLPLCTSPRTTGCVIAYSTFPSEPPADAFFGRPGQGVSLQSGQTATHGLQVACVNPAAIGGGASVTLDPLFLTATSTPPPPTVSTPWVSYPDLYSGQCRDEGGASWLQVDDLAQSGDDRPVVTEQAGPLWGYHVDDVNLALGDLVQDVAVQEAAYLAGPGRAL
jgi:hypothetical protein